MKPNKTLQLIVIIINAIGVICLIYFAVPYLIHDTAIAYPDAMLPAETWDRAGMTLSLGFLPLLIANVLFFLFVKTKQKLARFLCFIPSAICLIIVISYWVISLA